MTEIKTVKMTKDQDGSPNGLIVRTYRKGEKYDLPAELADSFCDKNGLNCATLVKRPGRPAKETPEDSLKVETPEG